MNEVDEAQVLGRLAAMKVMSVLELKAEWKRLFDAEAPNNSRGYLQQRLAYRIQQLTFGGPSKPLVQMLDALADEVEGRAVRRSMITDPRNPVTGTRLVREWNGTENVVTVLKDGFDWEGRRYKSLSAVAREMTGTRWNGYRFFGLREKKRIAA